MSGTLKYKMSERYSMGWTDLRGLVGSQMPASVLKMGDYTISDLFNASEHVMDIFHKGYVLRVKKEEFATLIKAFLEGKKSEDTNGGFRDLLHEQRLGVQDSDN